MPARVKLSAEGGGSTAVEDAELGPTLMVPPDTEVKLTAAVEPADPGRPPTFVWSHKGSALQNTSNPHTFTASEATWGKYEVAATVNGTKLDPVAVSVTELKESPEPVDDKVSETAPGEYDPRFTWISGLSAAGAALLTVILLAVVLFGIDLPAPVSTVADDQQVTGTWAQRFAGILALVLAVIGAVLVFGGLWLAALEARGRLRTQLAVERGALDGVPEVLDKARLLRGTIAVLVAGVAVLVVAATIGIRLAGASPGEDPQVSPSTPVAPSVSPTG
ncbi:hypothetical protein ACIBL3_40605 [Kribbella sp. NPDC050124]|uniref:hypothetical protein n=1 Tax=Kribbella sp. NPDC050124 TaxID=3364114 RepID=UPI0037B15E02